MTRSTIRIRRAVALVSAAACLATAAAPAVASSKSTGPPRPTFVMGGQTITVTERAYRYCTTTNDVILSRMPMSCMIMETLRDMGIWR